MNPKTFIRVGHDFPFGCRELSVSLTQDRLDSAGHIHVAEAIDLVMRDVPPHTLLARLPQCGLNADAAQVLIDDLWRCGIRPTEGSGAD